MVQIGGAQRSVKTLDATLLSLLPLLFMGIRTKRMVGCKPSATGKRKTPQKPQSNAVSDDECENVNPMSPSPTAQKPYPRPQPLVWKVPDADEAEDATAAEALLSLSAPKPKWRENALERMARQILPNPDGSTTKKEDELMDDNEEVDGLNSSGVHTPSLW